jgi:Arf-GAP/GTPase/ANK repeat/PH domain-containing protein 1/3
MHVPPASKEKPYFQIISLKNDKWKFETNTMAEAKDWAADIQTQIAACLTMLQSVGAKNNNSSVTNNRKYLELTAEQKKAMLAVPGNDKCADCDKAHPEWASLNLTTLVCIDCSGIHRKLGVHISRVRSLDLDDWAPDHYKLMLAFGNRKANAVFESQLSDSSAKPMPGAPREELEIYIRDKYENKLFLAKLPAGSTASGLLYVT